MQEKQVTQDEDGMRLDRWLRLSVPNLPQGLLQKHLRRGVIRVDGKKAKHDARVTTGQNVRFPEYEELEVGAAPLTAKTRPALSEAQQREARGWILQETTDWVAINKPAGLAVQGGSGITRCVEDYFPALGATEDSPLRLVHRIDKETSGILLLAKTRRAAQALTRAFKDKTIEKTYLAIVAGMPDHRGGEIRLPLAKRRIGGQEKMLTVDAKDSDAQKALSHYETLDTLGNQAALLALSPQTGRTHQLRVHCASGLDCPILGDTKYGGTHHPLLEEMALPKGLHLHAYQLSLPAMEIALTAPLPKHMKTTIASLGFTL